MESRILIYYLVYEIGFFTRQHSRWQSALLPFYLSRFLCLFVVGMEMARHTDGGDIRKRHAVELRTATRSQRHGEKTEFNGIPRDVYNHYTGIGRKFFASPQPLLRSVGSRSDHHGQPCDLSNIPLETIEFNPYILPDLGAIL